MKPAGARRRRWTRSRSSSPTTTVVVRTGLRLLLEAEAGFEVGGRGRRRAERPSLRARPPPERARARPQHARRAEPAAIPSLREEAPETQIVVLTMQDDPAFAREALKAGALGFVLKRAAESELIEAVRLAAARRALPEPAARRAHRRRAAARPARRA